MLEDRDTPSNLNLSMSAMPANVELGSPILMSGNVSSTQMMSDLSMTYLWGDSQSNTDPFTYSPPVGTMPVANQHTYTATGSYTITVTANATYENGSTDTATLNFPVSILPPASPPPPTSPPPGPTIASVRIESVRDTSEPLGVAPYEAVGQFNLMRFGGDVSQPLTVYYSVHGTATSLLDYDSLSGNVTFAAHATTATISLTALDDAIWEGTETVTAVLNWCAGYTVLTPAGSDTISIVDNDRSISGHAYRDADNDGEEDAGELRLPGIPVELWNEDLRTCSKIICRNLTSASGGGSHSSIRHDTHAAGSHTPPGCNRSR